MLSVNLCLYKCLIIYPARNLVSARVITLESRKAVSLKVKPQCHALSVEAQPEWHET